MCLCGYPTHYSFQYFFDTEKNNGSSKGGKNEIHLAENYKADMELADSVFLRMISESNKDPTAHKNRDE